jgi:hypothetical protein
MVAKPAGADGVHMAADLSPMSLSSALSTQRHLYDDDISKCRPCMLLSVSPSESAYQVWR